MGNMPRWWAGAAAALFAGVLVGAAGWYVGDLVGARLANGFTFDWFVHAPQPRTPTGDALRVASIAAAVGAFVAIALVLAPVSFATRRAMARMRHVPPRYREPTSLDVHALKLVFMLGTGTALVTLLLGFLYYEYPSFFGGPATAVRSLSAGTFRNLVAAASAAGAGATAALATWSTFHGLVRGTLVQKSERNIIARISLFGVRNPKTTVALVLATTLVAGYYATFVTTNVDVADVLPRGDPNTEAAHNLTQKFKSSFTQQVTFQFHVLDMGDPAQAALYEAENKSKIPNRVTTAHPENITDELYVRAIAETIAYVLDEDPFAGSVSAPDLFKLVNWTLAGGKNATEGKESFSLPATDQGGELRYATVEAGVIRVGSVYAAVDALTSPNWTQTAVLVTVDPKDDVAAKEIGQRALEVRDQFVSDVDHGKTQFKVFGPENPPQFSVDLPLANAHASELTAHDFKTLMPVIALFVAITLFIAFRNAGSVIVTFSALAVAVVWTFGAMGALRIPLNTINLAVVPLIMGVGIDYGIHMMNEFQEYRAKGMSPEKAWTMAGGGSAFALFVGALTTVAGLVVMIASPSLLVAQLGILGNIALAACYILAILFIPAAYSLVGRTKKVQQQEYVPSRIMPALAAGISRTRVLVVVLMLLLAGAAVASQSNLRREAFGDPPRNWLESDSLRQEHTRAIEGFYETGNDEVKANVLVVEGDITDPAVHAYINGLTSTLRRHTTEGWKDGNVTHRADESRIIADTLKDLPFLMNTWLTVKDGVPGAAQYLGAPALEQLFNRTGMNDPSGKSAPYPKTQAEMKATLDDVFASPLNQLGNLFVDAPDYEMTVIVFSVRAATYPDAEAVWNEVQAAIRENEPLRPETTHTSFFGNTAINYLFVAKQVPWLNAMNIVANVLIVLIVLLFTRRIGPTVVVGVVSSITSVFWFGMLPLLDIGLAISLTLPLIFISAMGSDYALHLAMRCSQSKDTRETFESVGKGVLFSFITTFGAFVIFTRISDLAGRRSIVATCLAIAVVFVVSLVTVPIIYPIKRKRKGHAGDERNVPVVESRTLEVAGGGQVQPAPASEAKR